MLVKSVLAVIALLKATGAITQVTLDSETEDNLTTDRKIMAERKEETESDGDDLAKEDKGLFSQKHRSTTKHPSPSPWCHKYGTRKKRSRYKLSEELNKKEPVRDILAQLDYDIEEQEMDKRSRIELLSYLDAALKNKNIELKMELRHLAKEEENLKEKLQAESVNTDAAVLEANIEQLNRRIQDLDERTSRMKKLKEQKLLEQISARVNDTPDLLNRQNLLSALNQQQLSPTVTETSMTVAPIQFNKTAEGEKPGFLTNLAHKAAISKQTSGTNFGYVPYQMPVPYVDPLQILRLTNPDFAALGQPRWMNPTGWAGYAPNLYPYPIERQYPQSLYSAFAGHQALPVPMRKV